LTTTHAKQRPRITVLRRIEQCVLHEVTGCDSRLPITRLGWLGGISAGEDRQCDTFILPLSYHDPGHVEDGQCDTFILPVSYNDGLLNSVQ